MLLKQRINLFEDITTAEVIHTIDLRLEILPEITQQGFPFKLAVRNPVEVFFKPGGEAVFDITGEETLKEGGNNTAAVFGDKAPLSLIT